MCSLPAASESPVSPVVTTRLVGCLGGRMEVRRFLEVSPLLSGPAVSQRLRQQPRALCL